MAQLLRPWRNTCVYGLILLGAGITLYFALPYQPLWTLEAEETIIGFTPDGSHFCTFVPSRDGDGGKVFGPVRVRENSTGHEVNSFFTDGKQLLKRAWSDDRRFLAAVLEQGRVEVIDFREFLTFSLNLEGVNPIYQLYFDPKSEMLQARASQVEMSDRNCLFELASRKLFAEPTQLLAVTFSPHGRHLAYWKRDGMHLWDRQLNKDVGSYVGTEWSASFSPDARRLITTIKRNEEERPNFALWDLHTHRMLAGDIALHIDFADAEFSPDGRWLATWPEFSRGPQILEVCDSATGKRQARYELGPAKRRFSVYTPDSSGMMIVESLDPVKEKSEEGNSVLLTFLEMPSAKRRWQRHFAHDIPPVQLVGYDGMRADDIRFSEDGTELSTFITSQAAWVVLNARNGESVRTTRLLTPESKARYLARPMLSPDGARLLSNTSIPVFPPRALPLWVWRWLPPPRETHTIAILREIKTEKELLRLDFAGGADSHLSPDGQLVLTELSSGWGHIPERRLQAWSVPPQRNWLWIIGIPTGLGAIYLLAARYRKWRRDKRSLKVTPAPSAQVPFTEAG